MPAFHPALHTRRGAGSRRDIVMGTHVPLPTLITAPTGMAVAREDESAAGLAARHQAAIQSASSPRAVLDALGPEACLSVLLDPAALRLTCAAAPGVWHYFRLADGAVKPLPPEPAPITFAAGDAYLALTPGAARVMDSPAVARFLHLRDDFNAEKLASALLDHLAEIAGTDIFSEDVTVLVIEAR